MNLKFVLGYTFYFVLGYYLNKITLSTMQYKIIFALGIAGFLATVLFSAAATYYCNEPNQLFYGNFTLNVLCEASFVFLAIKQLCQKLVLSGKLKSIVYLLAKYSFGAYLIHKFIIEALQNVLGFDTLSFNSLLAVPVIGIIVFVLSFVLSAIINHIPVFNKYIV